MKKSKLVQVLKTLSEQEFEDFSAFVRLRIKGNNTLSSFYSILEKEYPHFEGEIMLKKEMHEKIFPNEPYNDVKIRECISQIFKHLKSFLIQIETSNNPFLQELSILKQYRKRYLDNLFSIQNKRIEKEMDQDPQLNTEHFRRRYLWMDEQNNFFEQQHIRKVDESIEQKSIYFDNYYLSLKLRDVCEMLNRQNILNHTYDLGFMSIVSKAFDETNHDYFKNPSIACYYTLFKLLSGNEKEGILEETLELLNRKRQYFTEEEQKSMYGYTQNYCIRQMNLGHSGYAHKLFQINQFLINEKIILTNNQMSKATYRNMVFLAIKLKEYDWAESFIEAYKTFIHEKHRESVYALNKAYLLYELNNYEETIALLNQVEFTDAYYAVSAKLLLLKTYYATQEMDTLSYFALAFELYLKRNKEISSSLKKSCQEFLRIAKKLFRLKQQQEYMENEKIQHKRNQIQLLIDQSKNLVNKDWLIEELEKISYA